MLFFWTDTETCDLRKHMSVDYCTVASKLRFLPVTSSNMVLAQIVWLIVVLNSLSRLVLRLFLLLSLLSKLEKLLQLQVSVPPLFVWLAALASQLAVELTVS